MSNWLNKHIPELASITQLLQGVVAAALPNAEIDNNGE